jgi:hypothetical protein
VCVGLRETGEVECAWSCEGATSYLSQFSQSGSRGSRRVGQRLATCPCIPCIVQRYQDCELKIFPPPVVRKIVWSKASILKAVRRIQKRFRHSGRGRRMHFARFTAATMIQRRVRKWLRRNLAPVDVAMKQKRSRPNESDLSPGGVQPRKKSKRARCTDHQPPLQTNSAVTAVGGIIPRPPEDSEKHCGLCFCTFPQQCERSRATARCACDFCKWVQCSHCQRYFHNSCRVGVCKSQFRTRKKKLVCYACLACGVCGKVLLPGATQIQLLTPARRFVHPECLASSKL